MLEHKRTHGVGIRNVGFEKFVALAMFLGDSGQVRGVSGVGKNVDIAHRGRLVMFQNIPNKVAPDESTATGYKDAHGSAY